MDIGKAIKLMRRERDVSQDALAKKIGRTTTTLSLIENGRKLPTTPRIKEICDGLGVKPIYLLLWALERKMTCPRERRICLKPLRNSLVEEDCNE